MKRGFTLVEVVVAILLSALVALVAQGLLAAVLDSGAALARSAPAVDGSLLGRAWLLEACRGLEVGVPGATGFEGTGSAARFSARLLTADGWTERQEVGLEAEGEAVRLRARSIDARIVDSVDSPSLDYLVDGGGEGAWVSGWSSPVSAPLAIRVRWIRGSVPDTLLCTIGGRG